MVNSAITALGTVLFALVVASAAAISLSRFRFRGRTTVLTALLVAQAFPAVLLVIPLSTMLRSGHLLNSRAGLVLVYVTFATPFATYLLKGFLDGLPREAGRGGHGGRLQPDADGPAHPRAVAAAGADGRRDVHLHLRLERVPVRVDVHLQHGGADHSRGAAMFIGDYQIRWDLLTAGGVIAAVPVLVGFMLVQKQADRGLAAGAVKG